MVIRPFTCMGLLFEFSGFESPIWIKVDPLILEGLFGAFGTAIRIFEMK